MRRISKARICACLIAAATAGVTRADTVTGSAMPMLSEGSATLTTDGYAGTYLVVPAGGATVDFTVNATEGSGSSAAPQLDLVIANSTTGFTINSTSATNYTTGSMTLPAGTYSVSDERDYSGNVGTTRAITVNNMTVNTLSGSAPTFSNLNTDASGNALAAANTYISNYRQGTANLTLSGPNNIPLLAGTPITVRMGRNQFNFGTNISGNNQSDINTYLGANPDGRLDGGLFSAVHQHVFRCGGAVERGEVGRR